MDLTRIDRPCRPEGARCSEQATHVVATRLVRANGRTSWIIRPEEMCERHARELAERLDGYQSSAPGGTRIDAVEVLPL